MTDGPTTPTPPPSGGMPGAPAGLVERVKNILFSPKTEWPRIDAEPATIGSLYTGYVMILAAIGPIAMLIGHQLIGVSGFGVNFKPSLAFSLGTSVFTYISSLIGVYLMSLVIDALAPSFGGTKDPVKALKVAAYSSTAVWVAGILYIIPMLGLLVLLVMLYGIYLIYLGLPRLMRAPDDKAVGYTVVVVVVWIIVTIVIGMIVNQLVGAMFGGLAGAPTVVRY